MYKTSRNHRLDHRNHRGRCLHCFSKVVNKSPTFEEKYVYIAIKCAVKDKLGRSDSNVDVASDIECVLTWETWGGEMVRESVYRARVAALIIDQTARGAQSPEKHQRKIYHQAAHNLFVRISSSVWIPPLERWRLLPPPPSAFPSSSNPPPIHIPILLPSASPSSSHPLNPCLGPAHTAGTRTSLGSFSKIVVTNLHQHLALLNRSKCEENTKFADICDDTLQGPRLWEVLG